MTLGVKEIAKLIDISAVQTAHGEKEIRELIKIAENYGFVAVHTLPCWVRFVKTCLPADSGIMIGAPVGFPSGGHTTEIKIMEAKRLEADGVNEMDMMINVGKLKSGAYDYVEQDIRSVVEAVSVPVKVILEVPYLTKEEIIKGCDLAIKGGADFVKTSTGWSGVPTKIETVELILSHVENKIKVKVSGGIRDLASLVKMYKMGVSRFGINAQASGKIIGEVSARANKSIEV